MASGFNKDNPVFITVSAKEVADLRFIAGAIRDMNLDKGKASKIIQVRVENDEINDENIEGLLEATSLSRYLPKDNVRIVTANDLTLERTIAIAKETFGEDMAVENLAIGDASDLVRTEKDEEIMGSEDAPIYVQMTGPGIASQLLFAVAEIIANDGVITDILGGLEKDEDTEKYKRWYKFLPNIKVIDYNELQREMRRYAKILIAA